MEDPKRHGFADGAAGDRQLRESVDLIILASIWLQRTALRAAAVQWR
jgi:hypothetical protein